MKKIVIKNNERYFCAVSINDCGIIDIEIDDARSNYDDTVSIPIDKAREIFIELKEIFEEVEK